jgi:hypothetical protein
MQLTFSSGYHSHCQLKLHSGRTITLKSIEQKLTYGNMLEGIPHAEWNDYEIEEALKDAQQSFHWTPHLLTPPRRNHFQLTGEPIHPLIRKHTPDLIPEWLPWVRCIAGFESGPVDPANDGSWLTLVWFQDEFAMPIDAGILDQILALDWDSLATDGRE